MITLAVGASCEVQWAAPRRAHTMATVDELTRRGWVPVAEDPRYGAVLMRAPQHEEPD